MMTDWEQPARGDGRRGRRLVIGLVVGALVLGLIAMIYRREALERRPTTLPGDRPEQVLREQR